MFSDPTCQAVTKALHYRTDTEGALPVVTPLFMNSAFCAGSPYFYTRKNNPNCEEFEGVVATLEEAAHAISATTGMTAIALAVSLLKPGDRLVINKFIYGCSFKLFQRLVDQRGIALSVLDLTRPETIERFPDDTRMVFFETPTNPFLKTVCIAELAQKAKRNNPNILLVVDNTWATPWFQKPLEHGADLSVYSATKFFSGHSDVMGGVIATNRDDLADFLRAERFYTGGILDPHSSWLLRRSLQTFALRMRAHAQVTQEMASFLQHLPQVARVYVPEIDGRQLTGYGGILFFDLREDLVSCYAAFAKELRLFDTGTGMACVTSMVAQPFTGSHASMSVQEKKEMGLGEGLVRLCFGLEDPNDLKKDLVRAFQAIDPGCVK